MQLNNEINLYYININQFKTKINQYNLHTHPDEIHMKAIRFPDDAHTISRQNPEPVRQLSGKTYRLI